MLYIVWTWRGPCFVTFDPYKALSMASESLDICHVSKFVVGEVKDPAAAMIYTHSPDGKVIWREEGLKELFEMQKAG